MSMEKSHQLEEKQFKEKRRFIEKKKVLGIQGVYARWEISHFLHGWCRVQLPPLKWVGPLVRHHAVHLVDGCSEGPQTHLLRLVDDLRAGLHPLFRHHHIFVSVHQEVKGTWTECTVGQTTTSVNKTRWLEGRSSDSQAVSSNGRKVTVAVTCLMTERISSWMVLMDFSLGALWKTAEPSEHASAGDSCHTQLYERQLTAKQVTVARRWTSTCQHFPPQAATTISLFFLNGAKHQHSVKMSSLK